MVFYKQKIKIHPVIKNFMLFVRLLETLFVAIFYLNFSYSKSNKKKRTGISEALCELKLMRNNYIFDNFKTDSFKTK